MLPRQVYFYLCWRFHIEFFKTPSSAELHFNKLFFFSTKKARNVTFYFIVQKLTQFATFSFQKDTNRYFPQNLS